MSRTVDRWRCVDVFVFLALFLLVLSVYGALPFLQLPTLGQAVWTSGFAQSLVNQGWTSIYANNFGFPELAPVYFGLIGVIVTAIFIRLGLHASDAYTMMCVVFLLLAYVGAFNFSRFFGVKRIRAILLAGFWVTMPIIWTHSGYSMVSLGMALLPFYFFSIKNFLSGDSFKIANILLCFFACFIAVFMDGYSFMMFAFGSLLAMIFLYFGSRHTFQERSVFLTIPVALLVSYLFYAAYIGDYYFKPSGLDFFRAWGMDISFFLCPTKGVLCLYDALNFGIPRTGREFFGDASVWVSTFTLPIYVFGLVSWFGCRKTTKEASFFLLLAFIALYMALGPSFKFNSVKPEEMGSLMPDRYALFPTGTAFLSRLAPGFNNMRAAYRWIALGVFSCWSLIVLLVSQLKNKKLLIVVAFVVFFILSNMPHLYDVYVVSKHNREAFLNIHEKIILNLRDHIQPNELVAFLPYGNDFLVNYISSVLNIRTYNVGGDKNLALARKFWPPTMQQFRMGLIDSSFAKRVALLLVEGSADVVVLPRIDLLWGAHYWPFPRRFEGEFIPVLKTLLRQDCLSVKEAGDYFIVRVSAPFLSQVGSSNLVDRVRSSLENFHFGSSTPTKVGIVKDGRLYSQGQSGMLFYGPYSSLSAGNYSVSLFGSFEADDGSWVDVVADLGKKVFVRLPLAKLKSQEPSSLCFDVSVEDVKDLEIRVFVASEDSIILEGYSIIRNSIEKSD